MEALVEILLEVFLEVFFELLGAGITAFVNYLDTNSKVRTKLKNVLTFIFYGLCILLVTLSLIHKKSFLVIITLSYILVNDKEAKMYSNDEYDIVPLLDEENFK